MAGLKNILPDKRRATVLISLILLLAIFLIPYFFIFIPANADNLKRQAFLKLNRAAQNMIAKSNDTRNYYQNTKLGLIMLDSAQMSTAECSTAGKERLSFLDAVYFMFQGSGGWNILFVNYWSYKDRIKYAHAHQLPLETYVSPCLASGKEVFSSFLLVHYCQRIGPDSSGKIIYQDFRPGMEQDINLDSLIPKHQGMRSPDINDITLEGTDYKLFTYPFQLGRHRLVLCGLMKTDSYNAKLHLIPVVTSYTLVICLFLFLLSLPFLKIFMMNDRDRIYAFNLTIGIGFLFAMASFITIISTQLILLRQGITQVSANLDSLSVKIEDSLSAELTKAQDELQYFDTRLSNYLDSSKTDTESIPKTPFFLITISENLKPDSSYQNSVFKTKPRIFSGHFPLYHNSDHCGWISNLGLESVRIKYISDKMDRALEITLEKKKSVDTIPFVNVRARPYYLEMYAHFKYKKELDSTLMLAPVQSWASGEFRVNICRYSKIDGLMLQVMETRLYSLVNTVLPAGYGYCLFDESGNTLIHSDTLKSLRENFLDETGNLPWITGSIKARQRIESGSVPFYGTNYTLHIQPLKQHPLFLAVFYNNDYLEPMNLRILTFSLFFCLLTYGLLFLLFQVLYRRDPETCLYSPMEYYRRIVPSREKLSLYFNGGLVLFIYIVFFSFAAIFSPGIGYDVDYSVLVLGLLTPFNGLYALWLIQHQAGKLSYKQSLRFIWPVFFTGIIIFVISHIANWPLEPISFFAMEMGLCILLTGIVHKNGKQWLRFMTSVQRGVLKITGWGKKTVEEKKLFSYSWFVTLFIFVIGVLPVLEYSWFAYNHELRQSVKKEQLEIAGGLRKREKNIRAFLHNNQPYFKGNDANFDTVQYQNGIYPLFAGSVYPLKDSVNGNLRKEGDHDSRAEAFYLSIANRLNLFYKDPAGLPPLYDSSLYDNLYHWDVSRDSSEFDYQRAKWKIPPELDSRRPPDISFKIVSHIPSGLNMDFRLQLVFAAMILGLLLAIYRITKSMARQIYLTKIVGDARAGLDKRFGKGGTGIWSTCQYENKYSDDASMFLGELKGEYAAYDKKEKELVSYESDIVCKSAKYQALFECFWKTLDDKEKYLLYCLANDGLLNHKNETLIYGLLNKNLLIIYDERIRIVSFSFREFIISRNNTNDEKILLTNMQSGASWAYIRTIVLVIIMSVFIFLFLTQQEVSTKIIALITSLSALLPFILKFGYSPASVDDKK
jgi:preprotein translocase subunit YajC